MTSDIICNCFDVLFYLLKSSPLRTVSPAKELTCCFFSLIVDPHCGAFNEYDDGDNDANEYDDDDNDEYDDDDDMCKSVKGGLMARGSAQS